MRNRWMWIAAVLICVAYITSFNYGGCGVANPDTGSSGSLLPTAPSGLFAVIASSSQVNLSWQDNSGNEDGFKIERSVNQGTFTEIAVVAADTPVYSDTGLIDGNTYYYRVRAFNTRGNSAYSNTIAVTLPLAAPTNLSVTVNSAYAISLVWTDNSTSEDGFMIERKTGAGGTYAFAGSVLANITAYTNTGLSPLTTYYYRVRAYNGDGQSSYSNEPSATTLDGPASPNVPSGLTTTVVSSSQINLIWADNSTDEDGFKIERKTGIAGTYILCVTLPPNTTSYSDTALTQGTTYYYRIYAYNTIGNSGYSNEAAGTTIAVVTWAQVAVGAEHTVALKTDGTLWAWGYNGWGQLGLAVYDNKNTPNQIGSENDWAQIAAGGNHTLAIKTNGTLWAWGINNAGQLGLGDTTDRNTPTQVGADTDWLVLAVGVSHNMALKTNGTVWSWGGNSTGELGLGDTTDRNTPTRIGTASDWAEISCGGWHTLARKTNGTLWSWGFNGWGGLGVGITSNKTTPVQIGTDTNWAKVRGGHKYTIALKNNGTLWSWGQNDNGQLGLGDTTTRYVPTQIGSENTWLQISAAPFSFPTDIFGGHTLAIKNNGTLWVWGENNYGQLGLNDSANRNIPTQVGTDTDWLEIDAGAAYTIARKTNGALWACGINSNGELGVNNQFNYTGPHQIGTDTDWSQIATGSSHTIALKNSGALWAWGENGSGQLGMADETARIIPTRIGVDIDWSQIAVGANHTIATKASGILWGCGFNSNNELGLGSDTTKKTSPVQIGADTNWLAVSTKCGFVIALKTNKTLWAWGSNGYGQLGLGFVSDPITTPTQAGADTDWAQVTAGGNYQFQHAVALKTNGTLWAWGQNNYGQLGLGDTTNRNTPTQAGTDTDWSKIAAGYAYTIALKTNGTLWAWGENWFGQLGDGTNVSKNIPTQIGTDTNWQQIACGYWHTLAIKTDGTLWAWGKNSVGELGLGDTTDRNTPVRVGFDTDWAKITAHGNNGHTLAIKTNGTIWGWGDNTSGQLGTGDPHRYILTQLGQ
ncbi:MAG: fibronectin type III domain-containing protein [Candidatus Brocadiia bacterium]